MTRLLHRISRSACPPADRPWLDALFAESDAVESGRARLVWLLGALGLVADRHARRLASMITPTWLACLIATLAFAYMGFIEYEGLAIEDDWYPAFAAITAATLICVSLLNLRRRSTEVWP